jgi:uncharacterized protein YbcC (UPF0753/DUF2309 family)
MRNTHWCAVCDDFTQDAPCGSCGGATTPIPAALLARITARAQARADIAQAEGK